MEIQKEQLLNVGRITCRVLPLKAAYGYVSPFVHTSIHPGFVVGDGQKVVSYNAAYSLTVHIPE